MLLVKLFLTTICTDTIARADFNLKFIGKPHIIRHIPGLKYNDIIVATEKGVVARLDGENGQIKWRRQLNFDGGSITRLNVIANDRCGALAYSVMFSIDGGNGSQDKIPILIINLVAIEDGSILESEANGGNYSEGLGAPSPVLFSESGFTLEKTDATQKVKDFCLLSHKDDAWLVTLKTGQVIFQNGKNKERIEWDADPSIYGENAILTLICHEDNRKALSVNILVQRMVSTNFNIHFPIESIVTLECSPEENGVYEQLTYVNNDNVKIPSEYSFLSQKTQGQCIAQLARIDGTYYLDVYRMDSNLNYHRIELSQHSVNFTLDNFGNCIFILTSLADKHTVIINEKGAKHFRMPQSASFCYCKNNLVYADIVTENNNSYIAIYLINRSIKMIAKFKSSNKSKSIHACTIDNLKGHDLEEGIGDFTITFEDQTLQSFHLLKIKFERFESLSNVIKTIDLAAQHESFLVSNIAKSDSKWFIFEIDFMKFLYSLFKKFYQLIAKMFPFIKYKIVRPIPFTRSIDPSRIWSNNDINQFFTCEDFLKYHITNASCMLKHGKFDICCALKNFKHDKPSKFCGPFDYILYHLFKLYKLSHVTDLSSNDVDHSGGELEYKDVILCLTGNNMVFGIAKNSGSILYYKDFNDPVSRDQETVYNNVNLTSIGDGTFVVSNGKNLYFVDGLTGEVTKKQYFQYNITHMKIVIYKVDSKSLPFVFISDGNQFASIINYTNTSPSQPQLTQYNLLKAAKEVEKTVTVVKIDGDCIIGSSPDYESQDVKFTNMAHFILKKKWTVNYSAAFKRIVTIALSSNNQSYRGYYKINNDKTLSIPSFNPNLMYIISADYNIREDYTYPETMLDVLDISKGAIITSIILNRGASEPFRLLSTDNTLVLHYWNAEFKRHELEVIESYHSDSGISISSLVFGTPFGVNVISATKTRWSVSEKKFILSLPTGHFVEFGESIINARRNAPESLFSYFFSSIGDKILPNQALPRIHGKMAKKGHAKDYKTLIELKDGKILNLFMPKCRGIDTYYSEYFEMESHFAIYGLDLAYFTLQIEHSMVSSD